MSENPYEAPESSLAAEHVDSISSEQRDKLKKIAIYQKCVIGCILVYFALVVLVPLMAQVDGIINTIFGTAFVIVNFGSTIFAVLLAIRIYSFFPGIVIGLLTLVPCLSWLVLLTISGRATLTLREHGYRIGLFGVDLSEF